MSKKILIKLSGIIGEYVLGTIDNPNHQELLKEKVEEGIVEEVIPSDDEEMILSEIDNIAHVTGVNFQDDYSSFYSEVDDSILENEDFDNIEEKDFYFENIFYSKEPYPFENEEFEDSLAMFCFRKGIGEQRYILKLKNDENFDPKYLFPVTVSFEEASLGYIPDEILIGLLYLPQEKFIKFIENKKEDGNEFEKYKDIYEKIKNIDEEKYIEELPDLINNFLEENFQTIYPYELQELFGELMLEEYDFYFDDDGIQCMLYNSDEEIWTNMEIYDDEDFDFDEDK